ncbi:MAG: aspartate kinase [Cyclobacteriaceae bacterium]|nr:aspartate kinase [Cyclobacteriaceae bacterium]MDH4295019.1 aspartate kinase [Cyclobacteriaceae bacterium]MDH5248486.1 aspartate kinase [Cyclobacteriaceae bacterium]
MKVFKFGGAALKDAKGVAQVATIILSQPPNNLLVVVSAMGKTTDMLERILAMSEMGGAVSQALHALEKYHLEIVNELFTDQSKIRQEVEMIFAEIKTGLTNEMNTDKLYDQIVSKGELISSVILHHYLVSKKASSSWIDARSYINTDKSFREAKVDWVKTSGNILTLKGFLEKGIVITQGFIGKTEDGLTTTLGREGSDFSAAIFGSCLQAESVTIWKDVAGVMNADPKRFPNAVVFDELPFREAAEMTYYGASVIHPKTIKPLATKGIKLLVKNFDNPSLPGTLIHECTVDKLPPLIVFKENQCLISCKATDYAFISEQQLSVIFDALLAISVSINVMQNSAISFSFCIDFNESKVANLIERLQRDFEVNYNTGLTLITVKNYDLAHSVEYRKMPGVLLEQSSRSTLQVLVKGN